METRASHILIGAFTLLVVACSVLFTLWIAKSSLDREWDPYDIVFGEAVTGLSPGGAVQYNGIQVGEVRKLSLDPVDPRRVLVHVRLQGGTPVKTDTRAKLTFTGITGVAIIQLSGGTPAAAPLQPGAGQDWPTIVADDSDLQRLLTSGGDIIGNLSQAVERLTQLLDQDNLDKVARTLDHLETLSATLATREADIDRLLVNLGAGSDHLVALAAQARRTLDGFDVAAREELPRTLDAARRSLAALEQTGASATALLEENRAALSAFTHEGLPRLGVAVQALRDTLARIDQVAGGLQDQPARWLLGRSPVPEHPLP